MEKKDRVKRLALNKETLFNLLEPTAKIWGVGMVYEPSMYGTCAASCAGPSCNCSAAFACPK